MSKYLNGGLRWQKDDNGNLWFVAKDVYEMLGLTNVTTALQSLDDDEKDLIPKKSLGIENEKGQQDVNITSESGVYALIMLVIKRRRGSLGNG